MVEAEGGGGGGGRGGVEADLAHTRVKHGCQRGLQDGQQEFLLMQEDLPLVGRDVDVDTPWKSS